jgi:hypothetical protein
LVLWPPPVKMRLKRAVTPMHLIRLVTDDLHSRHCIENYLYRNTRLVSRRPFLQQFRENMMYRSRHRNNPEFTVLWYVAT